MFTISFVDRVRLNYSRYTDKYYILHFNTEDNHLLQLYNCINCTIHISCVISHGVHLEDMATRYLFRYCGSFQTFHHSEVLFT